MELKEAKEYAKGLIKYYDQGITLTFTDAERDLLDNLLSQLENSIPKSKIEEKIKTYQKIIDNSNDGDLIHRLFEEIEVLEELLKGE